MQNYTKWTKSRKQTNARERTNERTKRRRKITKKTGCGMGSVMEMGIILWFIWLWMAFCMLAALAAPHGKQTTSKFPTPHFCMNVFIYIYIFLSLHYRRSPCAMVFCHLFHCFCSIISGFASISPFHSPVIYLVKTNDSAPRFHTARAIAINTHTQKRSTKMKITIINDVHVSG